MYDIEMHDVSEEFARCWQAAGRHIQMQMQGPFRSWLKATLIPPFLEHLSFRLGNQLFFIRLGDVDGKLEIPGSLEGLQSIADGCKGHACLMPMHRQAGRWPPDASGWGLLDAQTGGIFDPVALVSDVDIPARFRKSKSVGAVFGLTCAKYQSGEVDWDGRISRCGDEMMRTMLYEAAQAMMRSKKWSWLKAWAMQIAKRRGMKKAITCPRIVELLKKLRGDQLQRSPPSRELQLLGSLISRIREFVQILGM